MGKAIEIEVGGIALEAVLNDSRTAEAIWETLPLTARGNTWGGEIYFTTPLDLGLETGQEVVEAGALGYWPPGNAFCIFFGPTPMSQGEEVRPASAVTVIGRVVGDQAILKGVSSGTEITVRKRPG
ncbi:cyclophilin-like fold protein [Chloroflexota bacterium]